ncbi:hypothetical protein FOZ62_006714, partial [Perkinsus olseni]
GFSSRLKPIYRMPVYLLIATSLIAALISHLPFGNAAGAPTPRPPGEVSPSMVAKDSNMGMFRGQQVSGDDPVPLEYLQEPEIRHIVDKVTGMPGYNPANFREFTKIAALYRLNFVTESVLDELVESEMSWESLKAEWNRMHDEAVEHAMKSDGHYFRRNDRP